MDPHLFDIERGQPVRKRPSQGDGATGDLFAPVKPAADVMRMAVYDCLVAHADGITRPEIARALGLRVEQIESRVSELLTRGRVKQIGKRDGQSVLFATGAA